MKKHRVYMSRQAEEEATSAFSRVYWMRSNEEIPPIRS